MGGKQSVTLAIRQFTVALALLFGFKAFLAPSTVLEKNNRLAHFLAHALSGSNEDKVGLLKRFYDSGATQKALHHSFQNAIVNHFKHNAGETKLKQIIDNAFSESLHETVQKDALVRQKLDDMPTKTHSVDGADTVSLDFSFTLASLVDGDGAQLIYKPHQNALVEELGAHVFPLAALKLKDAGWLKGFPQQRVDNAVAMQALKTNVLIVGAFPGTALPQQGTVGELELLMRAMSKYRNVAVPPEIDYDGSRRKSSWPTSFWPLAFKITIPPGPPVLPAATAAAAVAQGATDASVDDVVHDAASGAVDALADASAGASEKRKANSASAPTSAPPKRTRVKK